MNNAQSAFFMIGYSAVIIMVVQQKNNQNIHYSYKIYIMVKHEYEFNYIVQVVGIEDSFYDSLRKLLDQNEMLID